MDKKILLVKTGDTFAGIAARFQNFEDWMATGLGLGPDKVRVVDARETLPLPGNKECLGAVIGGSHSMVTENQAWSLSLEAWLREMIQAGLPVLGICYGHQVLARAMGGTVDDHPKGLEIGCVDIRLTVRPDKDPLFHGLPETFRAHVCHSQTVTRLPGQAVKIAENDYEPHHAFRIGDTAWGVQFHPEYSRAVMTAYVEKMSDLIQASGRDIQAILQDLEDTPDSLKILERFGRFCLSRIQEN